VFEAVAWAAYVVPVMYFFLRSVRRHSSTVRTVSPESSTITPEGAL